MPLFVETCRSHSLRITPQRIAIYKQLLQATGHPSADAVYKAVLKEFPHISFETVNRTLLTYAEIGILNIVESYSGVRRFDPDPDAHHHIHCVRCGKIIDFRHHEFDRLSIPREIEKTYTVVGKRVVVNVICQDCSDTESKRPS